MINLKFVFRKHIRSNFDLTKFELISLSFLVFDHHLLDFLQQLYLLFIGMRVVVRLIFTVDCVHKANLLIIILRLARRSHGALRPIVR